MKTKLFFLISIILPLFVYSQTSLVAYYPFNGNANDKSGNGNNGTVNGATLTTDRFGNDNSAYLFNGVDNYISITDNPNINIQTGESFTISYWTKHNGANIGKYMISKYMGSIGTEPSYGLGTGSSGNSYSWFEFTASNGIENRGAIDLNDANWHNIATVFKSGVSVSIYIDGVLDVSNSTTYTGSVINTNNLTIGCGTNLAQFYNGAIDDIKIYNKALTIEEIKNEVNGLVAYYPFNGNANDESGSENNGTVNGATLTTDRFGNANSAYSFNGTSDYIICNTEIGPFGTNSRSISFWAKTDRDPVASSQQNTVLSYGGNINVGGSRFEILLNPKCRGVGVDVSTKYITSSFDNSDNDWHFYTVVFDNSISNAISDLKFYGDGELLTTTCNTNGDININTLDEQVLNIGRLFYSGQPRYFKGSIDDIKIYNKALTATEIKNEANELIAYYPFNGNANDESGNNLHGTVNGATLTTDRFGNADSAYSFDGNDIITIAHDDILNCSNELSISVWVKPNSQQNAMILGKSNYTTSTNYLLRTNTSGFIDFEYKDFANSNSLPLIVNDWNHVAVVSNTDNSKQVYINGVLATHTSASSPYGLVTNPLTIGARPGAEFFNGLIDDLRIYKSALTNSQVLSLYTNNALNIEKIENVAASNFYVNNNILYFKNTQNLNELKSIEVYNILGQKVYKTDFITKQILFNTLKPGAYILKVDIKNNSYNTLKFIIY